MAGGFDTATTCRSGAPAELAATVAAFWDWERMFAIDDLKARGSAFVMLESPATRIMMTRTVSEILVFILLIIKPIVFCRIPHS